MHRQGLRVDIRDEGPLDGEVVVLLHGWPGGAPTWDRVAPILHLGGIRTLAPDQRGRSPEARPSGRRAYVLSEFVADVLALIDRTGLPAVHLVGHDWGGAVAWALAASAPERIRSLTVLSTPHPEAMASSLGSSDQALRSAYVAAFQVPVLPEVALSAFGGAPLRAALRRSGLAPEVAAGYVAALRAPGALTASLGWYRALLVQRRRVGDVDVPTRYLWSTDDRALGHRAAELTARHVNGPYRFEVIRGASHWLPEQHPHLVAAAILHQLATV